ncbi:MAG TPA: hypothetical protein VHB70_07995 [Parafilimonas sp.]|nr:hypothetical protein [Parafilimonas sp.]
MQFLQNDDATKSIAIITNYITAVIAEGLAERQAAKDEEANMPAEDADNEAEKRAARLQAEAEAEGGRRRGQGSGSGDGGKVRGGVTKRRVPSRRPAGGGGGGPR